ncbi:MAG TPA: 2-phosphosulfolactate phosphatase [Tepidisphaeraceae bacterium]|jgi:2-phosphosulfolactate phosphatase|nr:2-phosphosulfolactate phosphatase [Tepidisphaeraceae bacterium]
MRVQVVLLPHHLKPGQLDGRTALVFDVLRASTSMTAALAAGVSEIRIFADIAAAASARHAFQGNGLLCGETKAIRPPGFDLGNSPGAFNAAEHDGRTMFISTTNGTRAILACGAAKIIFVAALVNASAAAQAAGRTGLDITLVCSGTDGEVSMEDLLGCGAVIDGLSRQWPVVLESDTAAIAARLFSACKHDLTATLRDSRGGHNVTAAGLAPDIEFCATLDRFEIVGQVFGRPPVVRLMS